MSCKIRLARTDDDAGVHAIYAPFCEHTVVSFETEAPSVEEMAGRIARTLQFHPWLVCEEGGRVLGYAYATSHRQRAAYRWSVEVSAYVADGHRRRGLGRAMYTSLFRVLELQGFCNAYAGVTLPNPASVGLHEAMGFVPVGVYRRVGYKFGAWHDVGWWQLALLPHPPHPAEPRPVGEVAGGPTWEAALAAGQALLGA
jgi:L-amino acid N-acyltransferase YncA